MPIYAFEGKKPTVAGSAYVSPAAVVVGMVTVGERCYLGHGAIVRGDLGQIEIGRETALEEGVLISAQPSERVRIGRRVLVRCGATIHNAVIQDDAVIGMQAIVSDRAEIGAGAMVADLTRVSDGQKIPDGKLARGSPAKIVGDVDERLRSMAGWTKDLHVNLAGRYAAGALVEVAAPLTKALSAGLRPIGIIRTPFKSAPSTPEQGALSRGVKGEVILDPAYEEGLADLDGFSHIILLYSFHLAEGHRLKVTPFFDKVERGLFATRAARRPNPIGISVVRLLGIEGCRLQVTGVDMLDGTPLLDLKPYVSLFDDRPGARFGWLEPHLQDLEEEVPSPSSQPPPSSSGG